MVATTDQVPPVIAAPELEPGARLGDRYRLIARIGRGGGGAVWRAFDEKVGEELALKLIDGNTDLERWRREVALARRISHANVCRVYDLGEDSGLRWVTMEWVEGESLRALLSRGAIGDRERLMRQLVDAVAAIHAAGVVHRDLKPENVVVDGRGRAVIVDFGLARQPLATDTTRGASGNISGDRTVTGHGAVIGTPRYMAPEQRAGDVADARSDVYALGLVLHEIAIGAGEADAVATTISDAGPGDAMTQKTATAATVPRPWGQLIERCTAHAAADRLPDAVAVRVALAPRRRWSLAIGVALVLAVGAAAGAYALREREVRAPQIEQRRLTATAGAPATQPTSIALSSDGTTLAYSVGIDVFVRAIDRGRDTPAAMPKTPAGLPLARTVEVVGMLPDGRAVVQLLDRDLGWSVWALGPGAPPHVLCTRAERMAVAVSPSGEQIAIATPGDGLVALPIASGAARPLIAARSGERFGGLAWSPDGTRLAFVRRVATSDAVTIERVVLAHPDTSEVIAHERVADAVDQMTAWPSEERIVYVVNDRDGGATLLAVGRTEPLGRWPDEHVAQLAAGGGRIVVLRGTAERSIQIGGIDRRGYMLNLERGVPEHAPAGQLAGWAPDGRLVHAAEGELVVRPARGPAKVLAGGGAVPDTVAGEAVIYHRGAAIRRVSVAGREDRELVTGGGAVRCAGDRAPPCVIEELDRTSVRYLMFDIATGARGGELYRMPGNSFVRAAAVSPDGKTLAVADGSRTLALIAIGDGRVTHEALDRSAQVIGVSWSHDGASLLVSVLDGGEDRASVIRLVPGGARQLLLHSNHIIYGRIHEAPTGEAVAVQTRELALDAWLLEGL